MKNVSATATFLIALVIFAGCDEVTTQLGGGSAGGSAGGPAGGSAGGSAATTDFNYQGIRLGDSINEAAKKLGATDDLFKMDSGANTLQQYVSPDGGGANSLDDDAIQITLATAPNSDKIIKIYYLFQGMDRNKAAEIAVAKLGENYSLDTKSGENAFGAKLEVEAGEMKWKLTGGGEASLILVPFRDPLLTAQLPEANELNEKQRQKEKSDLLKNL